LLYAAFEIREFFAGTTDETITFATFLLRRNPATTLLERPLVAMRLGAANSPFDANANFAYELLISINK